MPTSTGVAIYGWRFHHSSSILSWIEALLATKGEVDKIIEAKVTRRRNHTYDPRDLKKSGMGD